MHESTQKTIMIVLAIGVLLVAAFWFFYIRTQQSQYPQQQRNESPMKSIETASGLTYIVLTPPTDNAAKPTAGQKIAAHYTGWLYDANAPDNKGAQFDSSYDRGEPIVFIVGRGQVIKGWDEALLDMKVGEKRRLIIPAQLAYGTREIGPIPANSTLVFDVELVRII